MKKSSRRKGYYLHIGERSRVLARVGTTEVELTVGGRLGGSGLE